MVEGGGAQLSPALSTANILCMAKFYENMSTRAPQLHTVCPRSSDPFYIVNYYINNFLETDRVPERGTHYRILYVSRVPEYGSMSQFTNWCPRMWEWQQCSLWYLMRSNAKVIEDKTDQIPGPSKPPTRIDQKLKRSYRWPWNSISLAVDHFSIRLL